VTKDCTLLSKLIYSKVIGKVIAVSGPKVAETTKLLENTFRAVNIALINEFALMCDKLKIDVWEVIEAAKTKPFGFMPFYPGPGLGGHCLPIDPLYLTWKSRLLGFEARLIELASQINLHMPHHVVHKIIEFINKKKHSIVNANIFVIGVTYKKDVPDIRESPAIDIVKLLIEKQARVSYYDPYVSVFNFNKLSLRSTKLTKENLAKSDCVVIITDHSALDYDLILKNSKLIFDTRNAYNNINNSKVIRI